MIGYAEDVDPATFSPALKQLEKSFRERFDFIPGPFRIWVNNEAVALQMKAHSDFTVRGTSLSQRENEIVILACVRVFDCEYVRAAHERNARKYGIGDEQIEALRVGGDARFADAREQAVFEVANEMASRRQASRQAFDRASESLGLSTVCEIAALFGFYATCCVSLNFVGAQPR